MADFGIEEIRFEGPASQDRLWQAGWDGSWFVMGDLVRVDLMRLPNLLDVDAEKLREELAAPPDDVDIDPECRVAVSPVVTEHGFRTQAQYDGKANGYFDYFLGTLVGMGAEAGVPSRQAAAEALGITSTKVIRTRQTAGSILLRWLPQRRIN